MASENEILLELKEMNSPLAALSRTMPYKVPDGYFDALSENLVSGVMATNKEDKELEISKEMPFALPDHYFKTTKEQILSTASLPADDMPMAVPDGYFESFPGKVMDAIREAEKGTKPAPKVIAFRPRWRAVQWAAAAMLIIGVGVGSYHMYNTPDRKASSELAAIDQDAIGQFVVQDEDAGAVEATVAEPSTMAAVNTLSNEEIASYLEETAWEEEPTLN